MSTGLPPPAGAAARRPPSRRPLVRVAIDVPATAARLQDVHDALARFWTAVARRLGSAPPGAWRAAFETAVAEVAANIVRHAYPPGFPPGTMRFRLHAYRDAIEARFADHGVGFQAPPAPGNDAPGTRLRRSRPRPRRTPPARPGKMTWTICWRRSSWWRAATACPWRRPPWTRWTTTAPHGARTSGGW